MNHQQHGEGESQPAARLEQFGERPRHLCPAGLRLLTIINARWCMFHPERMVPRRIPMSCEAMAGYIFLPVASDEMLEHAQTWIQGQEGNGKQPYQVLHNRYEAGVMKGLQRRVNGGCLEQVQPQDKVYILLHGTGEPDARTVGARRENGGLKAYTPEQLAGVLKGRPDAQHRRCEALCLRVGLGGNHPCVRGEAEDCHDKYSASNRMSGLRDIWATSRRVTHRASPRTGSPWNPGITKAY